MAFLVAGLLLAVATAAGAVTGGALEDGTLSFTVTRNGKPIGSHVYSFDRQGNRTVVEIRTNIDFRLFSLPVYRFKHESREIWNGNQLVRLSSSTDDNGEPIALTIRAEGPVLKVGGQDTSVEVDSRAVPASLWNRDVVERERLLDTVNGAVMKTSATDLGDDTVTVGGETVPARRFRLSGEYNRELWYDRRDGTLVRVLFKADDGSDVEYVRTQ